MYILNMNEFAKAEDVPDKCPERLFINQCDMRAELEQFSIDGIVTLTEEVKEYLTSRGWTGKLWSQPYFEGEEIEMSWIFRKEGKNYALIFEEEYSEYKTAIWTYYNYLKSLNKIEEINQEVFERKKGIIPLPEKTYMTKEELEEVHINEIIIETFKEQNPFKVQIQEEVSREIGFYPTQEIAIQVADHYFEKGYSVIVTESYAETEVYTKYIQERTI